MRYILLSMLLFFCMSNIYANNSSIYVDSLEDAIVLSEKIDKKILLIFSAKWCKYCRLLGRYLKDNPPALNNYIIVVIDYETNKNLVKQYAVANLPDSRIIEHNTEVSSVVGFDKDQYKLWLEKNK